jgi:hypothetical protein
LENAKYRDFGVNFLALRAAFISLSEVKQTHYTLTTHSFASRSTTPSRWHRFQTVFAQFDINGLLMNSEKTEAIVIGTGARRLTGGRSCAQVERQY